MPAAAWGLLQGMATAQAQLQGGAEARRAALLEAAASPRLLVELLAAGGPQCWGLLAIVGWIFWLLCQEPWRFVGLGPWDLLRRRDGAAPPRHWQRDPAALVLRTYWYGTASAMLWLTHLDPAEFKSWEDVYFFCGEQYQNCTPGFRWNGRGWMQAFALWNFVLSSALLVQKAVIAAGLGGLLPGEEVVTRESFISIAWRLVPYWMNQWEQQWGAECSSMLFELPHFALELLVVLPVVQILCGRLRVIAQPHVRELAQHAQQPGAAAPPPPAGGWVPDVMRCRWRHDPAQRRLLPRLKANVRAMGLAALILAMAASNSLLVPLRLEAQPARSQRADQILRLQKELAFLVSTGRHADTALWYQRLDAAAAHSQQLAEAEEAGEGGGGGGNATAADGSSRPGAAARWPDATAAAAGSGGEGAAGFLAAALEGSSNSSRLDAKLAVWSTLWQPLLPQHWLRAVLAADASDVAGLSPAYLSALQFAEHAESAELSRRLHAAANDGRAWARAKSALQTLLAHPERSGAVLPPSDRGGRGGSREATLQLLLMGCMAGGIDAKAAPLQLRPAEAASDPAVAADLAWLRSQQRLYAAKAQLLESAPSGAAGAAANASAAAPPPPTWQQQQRMAPLYRLLHKHCTELSRMRSADHQRLIPLVEVSLAIMRLSCERFFSLLAVFLGFLLFRDPPPAARRTIRIVAAFAAVFQRMVLYSFPAICWAYGAGALFSSFVSVVFWTGPLVRLVERMRSAAVIVQPRQWRAATAEEVERMGGQCAICWGDMVARGSSSSLALLRPTPGGEPAAAPPPLAAAGEGGGGMDSGGSGGSVRVGRGRSLPCGHAYHKECLQQWLQQCYGQSRGATCPMCQASVPLRVRYRLPWHDQRRRRRQQGGAADAGAGEQHGGGAAPEGIPGLAVLVAQLQDDFRARFEPMLDVPQPPAAPAAAQAQAWPPPEAVLLPPDHPEGPDAAAVVAVVAEQQGLGAAAGAAQEAWQQRPEEAAAAVVAAAAAELPAAGAGGHAAEPQAHQEPLAAAGPAAPGQVLQAQAPERRRGLLARLLRRRRGNG